MRSRLGAAAAAAASCIAVGIGVFVLTATAAAPVAAKPRPYPLPHGNHAARVDDFQGDDAVGIITNLTPYTWTLVAKGTEVTDRGPKDPWLSDIPATLKPGERFIYRLQPFLHYSNSTTWNYNGFFTYRVGTLNHPEYLSIFAQGNRCTDICRESDGPPLIVDASNHTSPPRLRSNAYPALDLGPNTPNPEITWIPSGIARVFPGVEASFDFTFETKGDYTVDASKDPPQLVSLLNSLCSGAKDTSCEFTASGPPTYGPGAAKRDDTLFNCGKIPGESDWEAYGVEVKRTATVSVGGELTVSAEGKIAGVVDFEVSVFAGYEHEWSQTQSVKFSGSVEVPRGYIGGIWDAPEIGVVTGTLVVKTGLASYTITNFRSAKIGVTPDPHTPPFVILTQTRKMTDAEFQDHCSPPTRAIGPPRFTG